MAAISAGITTFIWYAVGMVPVQIAAIGQFGLSSAETSSWIFIIWASGAVASIALSLAYRQPIPITSTIPGLLFMATLAGSYSYPELLGANLLAGVLIVILGFTGIGGRLLEWLPMPLAMGMLGGSILADVSKAVSATVGDAVVAGATVMGYLVGRTIRNQRIPPVGTALVTGAVAIIVTQNFSTASPVAWQLPTLVMPPIELTLSSFMAVSVPMVVLSMGLGNVQGLGFLRGQGYQVPVNVVTIVLGLNSIINSIFGGHAAIVSRNGMPIMASAEAGPVGGRYWANLISAAMTLLIAFAAYPVASLLAILPMSYVLALAGVAILPSFQSAVEQAFSGKMRFGAVVAFVIACTPFSLFGVSSAFWALIGGLIASLIAERTDLLGHWRRTEVREERREPRVAVDLRPSAAYQITGRRRTPILAYVRNLSDHGLSALSEQQLSPGDQLELMFRLPDGEIDVSVRVDVRHVDHLQDGPIELWEAGCEFRAGTPNALERLSALLAEQPDATPSAAPAKGAPAKGSTSPAPTPLRPPALATPSTSEVRAELIRAIAKDEFRIHYQPVVSFETHGIVEMEALLRWAHPERGLVEPSRFLPIAEQTGLIVSLGQRAIEQSCRQVREWQLLRGDSTPLGLAVNLSAMQLQHPELVEDVAQALWYSQLDPASLSLEFTESGLMESPDLASETLRRLKHLGVRLVLDDFGAGTSSLRRLAQLPLDAVKIDRSLICDLDTDSAQAQLVKSIIGAAHSMGLEVTAEGIETWGQQTLLRRMGCQRGQGYFFWSPQPVDNVPELLSPTIPALLGPSGRAISA